MLTISWLDCLCTVVSCMDGTTLVMLCPKHAVHGLKDQLLEQEFRTDPVGTPRGVG